MNTAEEEAGQGGEGKGRARGEGREMWSTGEWEGERGEGWGDARKGRGTG